MNIIHRIVALPLHKLPLYFGVAGGLWFILWMLLRGGYGVAYLFALAPVLIWGMFLFFRKPVLSFFFLYAIVFVIIGASRYVAIPIPTGVFVDALLAFAFLCVLLNYLWGGRREKVFIPSLFLLTLLWLVYCVLEVVNPQSNVGNWVTTVRGIAVYIVLFPLLVFLVCNKFKCLKYFLRLWAVLVLLAAIKAFTQKTFGFDYAEDYWLFTLGAARTHVIHSGIRYFSFFSDAANFGCHMGFAMVVFSILAIYENSLKLKIFYLVVVFAATYGMMISGTRVAMAVPFAGLACFVCIIREWKWIVTGSLIFLTTFMVFNFTTIGSSNESMRRMRTAFQFENDASYNQRKVNQNKMKQFMGHYPFGLGMGSAKHNTEQGGVLYGLATDSSMIFIWVETGIVGAILYVAILMAFLGYGVYCVMFKLKDPMIRGITCSLTSGYAGMLVAGYGNEVFHQFPTGPTLYICMAFIMLSPQFDKELMYERKC